MTIEQVMEIIREVFQEMRNGPVMPTLGAAEMLIRERLESAAKDRL